MAKTPQREVWERSVRMLAKVVHERSVSIDDLANSLEVTSVVVRSDVERLRAHDIPIALLDRTVLLPPMEVEALWKATVVGDRLRRKTSMTVKRHLADAVVRYVGQQEGSVGSLMFGNGTTVYATAERIFARQHDLGITAVYTANLLVLHALAVHQPPAVVKVAGGQLDRDILWFRSEQGIRDLKEQQVDAVVTSFMSLSRRGFWTQEPHELDEKLMNLLPHPDCRFVLIPIEWSKLAAEIGTLVAPPSGKGEEAFDFRDGHRKYVVFTDAPDMKESQNDVDRGKFDVLSYWEEKGVEVVTVPRPKETSSEVWG